MVFTILIAMAELASAETREPMTRPQSAAQKRAVQATAPVEPIDQLHNPRTGVTCTMRILRAEPVDKAAVLPTPEQSVDPDIRGRAVSPCVD